MTLASKINAEYLRASQVGGARIIEKALKRTDLPNVARWEIDADGLVRGQLALPDWSPAAAIRAVRDVHQAHGGKVRLRRRIDGARELAACIELALWDVELWAHTREPDTITLGRDNYRLRRELEQFAQYVDPLGWITFGPTTMRRHTASGWWELSTGYGAPGEWVLFCPDGNLLGELIDSRKAPVRELADAYISWHESQ
ncbi:hypothetical protein ACIBBE_42860 [Streptomyces sp. NPDC051644]|uniref:hypothetical protein n=1 Tax=Streptomyces sp. NPDC051644 TaxID=3365666 RepID=UPI0037ABEAE2